MSDEASTRRIPSTAFKKGQSGNPSGRPHRISELHALAQTNYPLALKRLAELIESRDEEMAFKAVSFCFCYILGKPAEARDLHNIEVMRARLTELVVTPRDAPALLPTPQTAAPEPAPVETVTAQGEPTPRVLPEAAGEVPTPPPSEPSGLRCSYRGKDGQCPEAAMPTGRWCAPHRAQLFSLVTE